MATSSSGNLGTQQENTKESDLTSAKAKPATPSKAELAAEELVAERLPDEVDSTVETNTDAVGEAVAQVIEATTFEEILTDGRVRIRKACAPHRPPRQAAPSGNLQSTES
jgi:hypothetical protein